MDSLEKKDEATVENGTWVLCHPYTTPAGEKLTEVTCKERLTVRDMREINRRTQTAEDYEINGVAVLCGLPADDLLEMDARDYMALRDRFFDAVGAPKVLSRG